MKKGTKLALGAGAVLGVVYLLRGAGVEAVPWVDDPTPPTIPAGPTPPAALSATAVAFKGGCTYVQDPEFKPNLGSGDYPVFTVEWQSPAIADGYVTLMAAVLDLPPIYTVEPWNIPPYGAARIYAPIAAGTHRHLVMFFGGGTPWIDPTLLTPGTWTVRAWTVRGAEAGVIDQAVAITDWFLPDLGQYGSEIVEGRVEDPV